MTTVMPPIIAPARSHSVGDYCAGSGANQSACDRSAGRAASQTADKRAAASTNQCAAQNAILAAIRAPRKYQRHHSHDECVAHLLFLSD
jgi:hypothetical protein